MVGGYAALFAEKFHFSESVESMVGRSAALFAEKFHFSESVENIIGGSAAARRQSLQNIGVAHR